MSILEEKEVFGMMDNMEVPDIEEILRDLPLEEGCVPEDAGLFSEKSMESIKNTTFAKLGIAPVKAPMKKENSLNKKVWFVLAAAMLLVTIGAALSPPELVARVKQALHWVPGMGIVVKDGIGEAETEKRYVLDAPIEKDVPGGHITIKGVLVDNNAAVVSMVGNTLNAYKGKSIFFMNAAGEKFVIDGWFVSGGETWMGTYSYGGHIKNIEGLALVLPDDKGTEISLPLQVAKSYRSYEEMGPTATVDGISITAIVTEACGKTKINLVTPPMAGRKIESYAMNNYDIDPVKIDMFLEDKNHKKYPLTADLNSGYESPLREFYVDTKGSGQKEFTLTIPFVVLRYEDQQRLEIDVPAEGTVEVNKSFDLAGKRVEINKVQRVDEILKVYVKTNSDKNTNEKLLSFVLDYPGYTLEMDDSGVKMIYLDDVPDQKKVKLEFKETVKMKQGPWVLKIKL